MTTRCPACRTENPEGAQFCQNCGAELPAVGTRGDGPREPTARAPRAPRPSQPASDKNPTVLAVLSFLIPGLGQFMLGDTKKGLVMIGVTILTAGTLWILMAPWSAYDAYQVAQGKGRVWA